ncbi:hypothetical protein GOP47_0028932 [Adiantum capillus-veneris]|nr:hypothetical protein GOP47_0028932 [Adiantum capillus-veneris]
MLPSTVYDNAKVRRRSQFKVMTQSLMNRGIRCNCGSCGIGGILGIFMLVGLLYLTILHSSDQARPLRSLQSLNLQNSNGKESLITEEKQSLYGRLGRKPPRLPPRLKFFGSESSQSNPLNRTDGSDHAHMLKQKTSINLLWENRQVKVVEAFRHAWHGYKRYALGYDELKPVSHAGEDGLGGLGATVVDALDTAIIMGLDDIVTEAGTWIEKELQTRIETKGQVNLFETTIRILGGLLSAYHLTGGSNNTTTVALNASVTIPGPKPEVYLERAIFLADRLMSAFSASPTAIPYSDVVLRSSSAHPAVGDGGASSTSEATTLELEFGYLSEVSGDPKYGAAAMCVLQHFKDLPKTDGLVPIYISPRSGKFHGGNIRLGSRGDSYYEYLLKVWLRHGGAVSNKKSISFLREMYDEAMEGVKSHLVRTSKPKGLKFVGELPSGSGGDFSPKMDHLVCFLAGNLALGATRGLIKQEAMDKGLFDAQDVENFQLAEDLAKTCYEMYSVTATGLAPEIAYFHMDEEYPEGLSGGNAGSEFKEDIIIHVRDRHNLLRPETVESLFILYRITGDSKYRDWGWKIFQAFESHTKVESGGFSSLDDVTTIPAPKRDKMETFFLGETLKYFYLLFGDASVLPLDEYVFNTEAHPLPIVSLTAAQAQ